MTVGPLTVVAAALSALAVLFVLLLVIKRMLSARSLARREAMRDRFRPIALAIVGGGPVPLVGRARVHCDPSVFADLLIGYAQLLRGPARERAARFFDLHGDVVRELRSLGSRRVQQRAGAAYRLGDMGSPAAIPALLHLLEHDDDREVRSACARSLGTLGAAEAVPALVQSLVKRRVPHLRAAQALLAVGPGALPELLVLLGREDPEVRAWAAELIGLLGDASHGDVLIRSLRDSSAQVRGRAARALGRLGAAAAAEGLRGALGDRVPSVRTDAAFALGRLQDDDAVPALLALARTDFFEPARSAADALARIDPARLEVEAELPGAGEHLREAAARVAA